MINPMGKGILTFNNSVSIRGYDKVNLLAAVFMIMYGPEHEKDFVATSGKTAMVKRNQLFMDGINPIVERKDAIVEVMATYLTQSSYAKSTFDKMDNFESSDEEYQKAMELLKSREVSPIETVDELVEESQSVIGEVEAVTENDEPDKVPDEKQSENIETPFEVEVSDKTEEAVAPTVVTPEKEVSDADNKTPVETETTLKYTEDLVIMEDSNKYMRAIKGKVTQEVREFKTMANTQTAIRLCNKLIELLPGEDLIDIIYNKDVVHVLFTEFEGAAYLLSSFRVLAIGIATGGVRNA